MLDVKRKILLDTVVCACSLRSLKGWGKYVDSARQLDWAGLPKLGWGQLRQHNKVLSLTKQKRKMFLLGFFCESPSICFISMVVKNKNSHKIIKFLLIAKKKSKHTNTEDTWLYPCCWYRGNARCQICWVLEWMKDLNIKMY